MAENNSTDLQVTGGFTLDLRPAEGLLEGTDRLDFTKEWTGEMAGTSTGVMLSAGDPESGQAGYVALERFQGSIGGRRGTVVLQQFGSMRGESTLYYEIAPGSGTEELAGIAGAITIEITDGRHTVEVHYTLG